MKYLKYSSLVFLFFLLAQCANQATEDKETSEFSTFFDHEIFIGPLDSIYRAHPNSKGLMVHIECPDKNVSWSGSAGYSDFDEQIPLELDQPALIASSIKTYVSASILRLVELGKTSIDQPITHLISASSKEILEEDGYVLDKIQIKHLLSHTSGIQDYINPDFVLIYLEMVKEDKMHRWTRDEQIALTAEAGDPLAPAGEVFNYADANYLLLTEIIEHYTQKPFYTAMRELLLYDELGFQNTWFYTLEDQPLNSRKIVRQYNTADSLDTYNMDPSFDLYGGGGIATTTKEMAQFSWNLFNGNIVKNDSILNLIYTEVEIKEPLEYKYYLGLSKGEINGMTSYGHGGFWGTVHHYIPELNTSISVVVLERDERTLRKDILDTMGAVLIKI